MDNHDIYTESLTCLSAGDGAKVPESDSDVVTETDIPKTGDASAMAIALAAGAVAMGALVVLKKKQ